MGMAGTRQACRRSCPCSIFVHQPLQGMQGRAGSACRCGTGTALWRSCISPWRCCPLRVTSLAHVGRPPETCPLQPLRPQHLRAMGVWPMPALCHGTPHLGRWCARLLTVSSRHIHAAPSEGAAWLRVMLGTPGHCRGAASLLACSTQPQHAVKSPGVSATKAGVKQHHSRHHPQVARKQAGVTVLTCQEWVVMSWDGDRP